MRSQIKIIATYKIINIITEKFYYGSSKDVLNRFRTHLTKLQCNKHPNIFLQRTYNKHTLSNFRFVIDKFFDTVEDALEYEDGILKSDLYGSVLYNLNQHAKGGDIISYHPRKQEICEQIRGTLIKMNSKYSPEERKVRWGRNGTKNGMWGKTHTDEVKEKLRQVNIGRASWNKGKSPSEESRKKMSIAQAKRTGERNSFYGKTHTEEAKEKMRQYRLKNSPNSIKVIIDGVLYNSYGHASREIGVAQTTIRHRVFSKNFTEYKLQE